MARTPVLDQYVHSIIGVHPAEYDYEPLKKKYDAVTPRVLAVLKAAAHGEQAPEIQRMLQQFLGFTPHDHGSRKLEALLNAVRDGSDPGAAARLREQLDRAHDMARLFAVVNGTAIKGPDKYEAASDAVDLTRADLAPILKELGELYAVLKGDAYGFEGHVPLLLKLGFTGKTAAAILAVKAEFPIIANIGTQVAVVEGASEAPPAAATGILVILAEAATFIGTLGLAIGYVIQDIGIWLNAPTLVPKEFFHVFSVAADAKKNLEDLHKQLAPIKAHADAMPARLASLRARVEKLVHLR